MLTYLTECMAVAVQTAIGACLWFGVVIVILALIAIAAFLLNLEKKDDVDSFIKGLTQGDKDDG